jgi:hypothetical protein
MFFPDSLFSYQVSYRPRDLQYPVVCSSAEPELSYRHLQEFPRTIVQNTILFELSGHELSVTVDTASAEPVLLALAS